MTPTLESAAASLRTSNMLVPLVLGDLTDDLARRRTRGGDGPSIAWLLGHILDFRCQFDHAARDAEGEPVPGGVRHLQRERRRRLPDGG